MFDTNDFWYKTFEKTVDHVSSADTEASVQDTLVIFINVEKEDEAQRERVVKKTVENISWLARKTDRERVVLHSFAYLSESKSSTRFAEARSNQSWMRSARKGLKRARRLLAISSNLLFM